MRVLERGFLGVLLNNVIGFLGWTLSAVFLAGCIAFLRGTADRADGAGPDAAAPPLADAAPGDAPGQQDAPTA